MKKVMIAAAVRTPLGIFDGNLKTISEQALAASVMNEAIARAGIDAARVDEIILGNAKQTSLPSNCARHASLLAKLPESIPAYTVHRQSASGLQAIANGFWSIRGGDTTLILAGGTESMSRIPREIQSARFAFSEQSKIVFDPIPAQIAGAQPQTAYGKLTVASVAESIARAYEIGMDELRAYAYQSRERARAVQPDKGILPLTVKKGKMTEVLTQDELSQSTGLLADAGDGAAVCLLAEESQAEALDLACQVELVSIGISAGDPRGAGYVGIEAVKIALQKAGLSIADIGQLWLNEQSAAQGVAFQRELIKLGLSAQEAWKRVNPCGGALAYGSPWGASGAVLTTRAVYGMDASQYALVVSPAEGGQAMAMILRK